MAFAAVVFLFARTYRISVAAYAHPIAIVRRVHRRRASGSRTNREAAASPERKHASCMADSADPLIAAPPVEKSSAAASSIRRLRIGELMRASLDLYGDWCPCRPRRTQRPAF